MADAFQELLALREATRVRINPETRKLVGEMADTWHAMAATAKQRQQAQGLFVLLAMHDKLEALRNG